MKIIFFGDSITDMDHNRTAPDETITTYGFGYPYVIASKLSELDPNNYHVINRGIAGDRIVDLYARIKKDVWNNNPDVISILIGINEIWHENVFKNGTDPDRFEKVYRMVLEDTYKVLPNVKIMLLEPFYLDGSVVREQGIESYKKTSIYREIVKKLAIEYNCTFVSLQDKFDEASSKFGPTRFLYDGVHPNVAGATLIANEWMKSFLKIK